MTLAATAASAHVTVSGVGRWHHVAISRGALVRLLAASSTRVNPPHATQAFQHVLPGFISAASERLRARDGGGLILTWPVEAESEIQPIASLFAHALGPILPETRQTDGRVMEPQEHVAITLTALSGNPGRRRHFADPQLPWPLHTDRSLHEDVGDYLLVAKAVEERAFGGGIRLLHVDDVPELAELLASAHAFSDLEWRGDVLLAPLQQQFALVRTSGVHAPVFSFGIDGIQVRFTDARFRRPRTPEQGAYLRSLDDYLARAAEQIDAFRLPVGGMYVINNRTVLHGREGFANAPGFARKLLRFCGRLA